MTAAKLAAVVLLTLLAGQVLGWRLLDQAAYALAGVLAVAFALSRLSLAGVRASRRPPPRSGQVGQVLVDQVRLDNASWAGKLWIEVQDRSTLPDHQAGRVMALGPGRSREWTVHTLLRRRGRFRLGPLRLRAADPFGLFPVQRGAPEVFDIFVYPATVDLAPVALRPAELPGGQAAYARTPQPTPTAGGVRDYATGDAFNRIAWSATARLGRLMVKEFDREPSADFWLLIDLERWSHLPPAPAAIAAAPADPWRETTEEYCVTVAASLARHLLERRLAVGLVAVGQHHVVVPADRGPRQLGKLLSELALVRAEGGHSLHEVLVGEITRFSRHDSIVIITPSADESWIAALETLLRAGIRVSVALVDASSFGRPLVGAQHAAPLLAVSHLAALGVPTHLLRRDDDLAAALRAPDAEWAGPPRSRWNAGGR